MHEVPVTAVPADSQLIDVREPHEYEEAHARGAINIPMGEIEDHLDELDTSRDLYIICRSGARSATVVRALAAHNITAINVSGGTLAWLEAGLPEG